MPLVTCGLATKKYRLYVCPSFVGGETVTWRRQDMEKFSVLLALSVLNPLVTYRLLSHRLSIAEHWYFFIGSLTGCGYNSRVAVILRRCVLCEWIWRLPTKGYIQTCAKICATDINPTYLVIWYLWLLKHTHTDYKSDNPSFMLYRSFVHWNIWIVLCATYILLLT